MRVMATAKKCEVHTECIPSGHPMGLMWMGIFLNTIAEQRLSLFTHWRDLQCKMTAHLVWNRVIQLELASQSWWITCWLAFLTSNARSARRCLIMNVVLLTSTVPSGKLNLFCTTAVSSRIRRPFSPSTLCVLVARIIISVRVGVTLTSTPE